ncbi:hypothetical protein M758_8G085800 [Ceratodon purpureus]|nr:hypothetical protein M758_8G085800 [Ceratodon purpureus]
MTSVTLLQLCTLRSTVAAREANSGASIDDDDSAVSDVPTSPLTRLELSQG